ncbi:tetratricopeptide repeat protein [Streptomyces sp. NPDC088196]|uniref:tetratricopeptide repeat protein n=1 Tax=Streptomyces sp. NPDC088196 TaxID=3154868 RepID=UPI00344F9A1B
MSHVPGAEASGSDASGFIASESDASGPAIPGAQTPASHVPGAEASASDASGFIASESDASGPAIPDVQTPASHVPGAEASASDASGFIASESDTSGPAIPGAQTPASHVPGAQAPASDAPELITPEPSTPEPLAPEPGTPTPTPPHARDQPTPTPHSPSSPHPAQLPPPPAHFTGRADTIHALRDTLAPLSVDPGAHPLAVISGMAGVGKSALALRVAHELRNRFPDGQLYVNLHGATPGMTPLTPGHALHALLRDLGAESRHIPEHPDAATALLRSLLAPTRTLLVLDDAASAAQVRPLLPGGTGCAVIVTSRSPLTALDGARRFPLSPLSGEDSAALLRAVSGRAALDAAHPLVELTGRLPLALRVVAARLAARRALTPDVLAGQLAATESRLPHLEYDDLSVRRSLAVAHDALAASVRRTDRDAARTLRHIGALDLPSYGAPLLARLATTDEQRAASALDRLVDVALLEETAYGRYTPHDLVRDFARELAKGERCGDAARAEQLGDVEWVDQRRGIAGVERGPAVGEAEPTDALAEPESTGDRTGTQPRTATATATAAAPVTVTADVEPPGAIAGVEPPGASIEADLSEAGLNAPDLSEPAPTNPAPTNLHPTNPEPINPDPTNPDPITTALAWYAAQAERTLTAIVEPGLDQDDRRRPTTAQLPGHTTEVAATTPFPRPEDAFAWGDLELENIVALVTRYRDTPDLRWTAHLSTLVRLLFPYILRSGRVAEMDVLGRAALDAARRLGDAAAEAYALGDLAGLHFLTGRQNEALVLNDQALAIWWRLDAVSWIRRCLNNRGLLLEGLGRYAESGVALRQSLAHSRQLNDPHGEAVTHSHLGNLYEHTDPRAAIEQHRRSLAIGNEIGAVIVQHSAHCNIGYAHLTLGEPAAAVPHFEESLSILGSHGDWHGESQTRLGLVRALRLLGRTEPAHTPRAHTECAELLRRADARADRYMGGLARHQLGLLLREQGRAHEAYDAWRTALDALAGTDEKAVVQELGELLSQRDAR